MFLDRVIHYGGNFGDQVKGRSPKKLKSIIEVPDVAHVKVHVLIYEMKLISAQGHVLRPTHPFWEIVWEIR